MSSSLGADSKHYYEFVIDYLFGMMKNYTEFGLIKAYHLTPRKAYDLFPMAAAMLTGDRMDDTGHATIQHNAEFTLIVWVQSFWKENNAEVLYDLSENLKRLILEHPNFAYTTSGGTAKYPLMRVRPTNVKIEFGTTSYDSRTLDKLEFKFVATWIENIPTEDTPTTYIRTGPDD